MAPIYVPGSAPAGAPGRGPELDGLGRAGTVFFWTCAAAGLAIITWMTVVGITQYLRLDALDDYRDGFSVGSSLTSESTGSCAESMAAVYDNRADADGWHAFLAGCRDATSGQSALSWYELRGNLGATASWGSD